MNDKIQAVKGVSYYNRRNSNFEQVADASVALSFDEHKIDDNNE